MKGRGRRREWSGSADHADSSARGISNQPQLSKLPGRASVPSPYRLTQVTGTRQPLGFLCWSDTDSTAFRSAADTPSSWLHEGKEGRGREAAMGGGGAVRGNAAFRAACQLAGGG